ncbi:XRE family transcriptional regulator [Flavobacterium sp. 140616W15]|nr:XRE family transcriptional regulator [Flavobacterium sp. 140616W15]
MILFLTIHINKIGLKIKARRKNQGLSQDNIAFELGTNQPSYARLEKEDDRISITRLIKIANILNTSVSMLINENFGTLEINEKPKDCISNIVQENKEDIQTLKSQIFF